MKMILQYAILDISESGEFEFKKKVIDNSGQDSKLPKDIDKIISKTMVLKNIKRKRENNE